MERRPARPTLFPYTTLFRSHRERVHHRREHAHIIGAGAIESLGSARQPAEDIAPADDHANLESGLHGLLHFRGDAVRSEEHTSELQSSQISYAVFCSKKKNL